MASGFGSSTRGCSSNSSKRNQDKMLYPEDVEEFLQHLMDGGSEIDESDSSDDELGIYDNLQEDNGTNVFSSILTPAPLPVDHAISDGDESVSDEEPPPDKQGKRIAPEQKWKKKKYTCQYDTTWQGEKFEADTVLSPFAYFNRYIPDTMYQLMADETNRYSILQTGKPMDTNATEIRQLIGMHIVIGILQFPRLRMYWNKMTYISSVGDTMTRNRFEKLRNNLHVAVDQPDGVTDRLWKVRPVIHSVMARCHCLAIEENICIDEQIIPFKGKLNIKQYIKNKPTPWGIKCYVLCGSSGLVYDMLVYQGKTTPIDQQLSNEFGVTGAVVLKLSERIPLQQNHKLFADNFFTGIELIKNLQEKGIFYAGTINKNRMQKCPVVVTLKQERGTSEEIVTGDERVVVTQWVDNKVVCMASTYIGKGSTDNAKRWSKKTKEYVTVERPQVIQEYNKCMGGVDKTDFLLQLYRIFIRSRKWTLRVIFHFICLAITNSWLEYRRDAAAIQMPKSKVIDLLDFTFQVSEALLQYGVAPEKKVGKPHSITPQPKHKRRTQKLPVNDVRYDCVGHWPTMMSSAGRCKFGNIVAA